MKHEIRMAKEKYYEDNISGNHNKDSVKWWEKINKLTGWDKSNNFSLTDPIYNERQRHCELYQQFLCRFD